MSTPAHNDPELIAAARADGMGDVIDIVGIEGALELMRLRGGLRVSIPLTPGPEHWLALALGKDAARKLAWFYGGTHLRIPLGRTVKLLQRDREILTLHERGMSCPQIASRFGITDRTIRDVLARYRSKPSRPIAATTPVVPGFSRQQITFLARRFGKPPEEVIALLKPDQPTLIKEE